MERILLRERAFINGEWRDAETKKRFAVLNPANGEVIAHVADCGAIDAKRAIEAAHGAFEEWRSLAAKQRAALLRDWFDLIIANTEALARLMTREQGKPLAEARGEVAYGAAFIEWFAEEAKRVYGDIIPAHLPGKRILVLKQPIGVVGAITPWNFPLAMITRKAAPALAAGCTFVAKPPDETPLCALALAELGARAGLPPGVFNIVPGLDAAAIGKELTQNPLIRKFSFTGSTGVGKLLMAQCASTVKKVSLELGGNAPFIVFADGDLDAAADGALASKYRNTGQTCVCANRIYVQAQVADAFCSKLKERVSRLVIGDGLEPGVTQGPLITMEAVEKVEALLADAKALGAQIALGGRRHQRGGTFFEPTIVTHLNEQMRIAQEEIFGPVSAIYTFKDEDEVLARANATPFGLAAYVYTRDIGRVMRVAERLECGIVGVNEGIISTEVAPFGGVKESGIGREGSKYGIEEMLELKYVLLGGIGA